jgi:hypothetical protein
VYKDHLGQLKALMHKGIGVPYEDTSLKPPQWQGKAGENLAASARVEVSGHYDEKKYPVSNINDGRYDLRNNSLRWVSDKKVPNTVELSWDKAQTFNAARIITGQSGNGRAKTPITDFSLQYSRDNQWENIPGVVASDNTSCDWHARFDSVTASKVRLIVTNTPGDITRIWELGIYNLIEPAI